MKKEMRPFTVTIPTLEGDEIADRVKVMVPVVWKEDIEEFVLAPEALHIIEDTKARYMGLLSPDQLKQLRTRLRLSQKEIADLLQIGDKSWSRWESGKQRPSRSVNLLIKALWDGEIDVPYLRRVQNESPEVDRKFVSKFLNPDRRQPFSMDVVAGNVIVVGTCNWTDRFSLIK